HSVTHSGVIGIDPVEARSLGLAAELPEDPAVLLDHAAEQIEVAARVAPVVVLHANLIRAAHQDGMYLYVGGGVEAIVAVEVAHDDIPTLRVHPENVGVAEVVALRGNDGPVRAPTRLTGARRLLVTEVPADAHIPGTGEGQLSEARDGRRRMAVPPFRTGEPLHLAIYEDYAVEVAGAGLPSAVLT